MKRFSQMSREELTEEARRLREELARATKEGMASEVEIIRQKYYLCLSYLDRPDRIKPGQTYRIDGEEKEFTVEYVNGVMAWGKVRGERSGEPIAFPIGRLMELDRPINGS